MASALLQMAAVAELALSDEDILALVFECSMSVFPSSVESLASRLALHNSALATGPYGVFRQASTFSMESDLNAMPSADLFNVDRHRFAWDCCSEANPYASRTWVSHKCLLVVSDLKRLIPIIRRNSIRRSDRGLYRFLQMPTSQIASQTMRQNQMVRMPVPCATRSAARACHVLVKGEVRSSSRCLATCSRTSRSSQPGARRQETLPCIASMLRKSQLEYSSKDLQDGPHGSCNGFPICHGPLT